MAASDLLSTDIVAQDKAHVVGSSRQSAKPTSTCEPDIRRSKMPSLVQVLGGYFQACAVLLPARCYTPSRHTLLSG